MRARRKPAGDRPGSAPPAPLAVEVAAGLVFRDGKLLITQRRAADHLGGFWEFPGGKREEAESFEQCLARELREELGIEVTVGECVETIDHCYPEKAVHLRFYVCRWREHEPQALACATYRWITLEELGSFDFPAADARLLDWLRDSEVWRLSDENVPARREGQP